MREILFRGKRTDNGEWVIGFLSKTRGLDNKLHICIDYEEKGVMCSSIVIPETVSQYTGLTDKNGKKIFEGDILKYTNDDNETHYLTVAFEEGAFLINDNGVTEYDLISTFDCLGIEVAGNIHENPELLKEAKPYF